MFRVSQYVVVEFVGLAATSFAGTPMLKRRDWVVVRVRGKGFLVFLGVKLYGDGELAGIVRTNGGARTGLGSRECRKKEARENPEDTNDDEEFDQGETVAAWLRSLQEVGRPR